MLNVMNKNELFVRQGIRIPGITLSFIGGSRATVDPPPEDTDLDIFIHSGSPMYAVADCLHDQGFRRPEVPYAGEYDDFATFRKGEVNLLVFNNVYEFGAVWGATHIAKVQNIKSKVDRYKLFGAARSHWRDK